MPKPIKRHIALQPTSREHHHGLLLAWKIREGLRLNRSTTRIKAYVNWFWENHLIPHFAFEEEYIFSILGTAHPHVIQALDEHGRLRTLFSAAKADEAYLRTIEKELTAHIRFEERILFNEIQNIASPAQLELIQEAHTFIETGDWEDEFWTQPKST